MSKYLAEQTLAVAAHFVGVKEHPPKSNDGPEVSGFLKAVGLPAGYPWCAAFVWCAVAKAAAAAGEENPLPRTGGVGTLWAMVDSKWKTHEPKRGCIFIHLNPDGHGHCGFVTWVDDGAPGALRTLEGNTDASGSREGDGVYERTRPLDYAVGYIDLTVDDGPPPTS